MFENIKEIEKKYGLIFSKNDDEKIVLSIFNSLELKEKNYNLNDSNILVFIAIYYRYVKKDYENEKKYYLMAVEKGNKTGMNNLGYLYDIFEKDYKNAKKYYLMAIENGNKLAMNNLGSLYHNVEKDYENAKKYYLMAIENGCNMAMNNLGYLYYDIEKDYENAKKYWLMAIEKGNTSAMNNIKSMMDNLELYISLKKITNKNELIENKITNIRKKRRIIEYENKLAFFSEISHIKDCEICLKNNKLHLLMECGRHSICEDCFVKVEKCPYCRY